jgi:hypothetical protein
MDFQFAAFTRRKETVCDLWPVRSTKIKYYFQKPWNKFLFFIEQTHMSPLLAEEIIHQDIISLFDAPGIHITESNSVST